MPTLTRRGLAALALPLAACARPTAPTPAARGPERPDATELAARIRRGDISAAEAVEAAIRRSEALQGQLNFMVSSDFDRALDKARAGRLSGPFAGVPFLIKDLDDYAGLPTRMGSRARLGAPPAASQDAYMDAFDRTGLVVIGKSSTPEFGFLPTTEPLLHPATRNPWNLSRSAGGSSGGAAAAVAAGIVPVAHASDGGGSIRIPAACCGLFGLKPSRGRMISERGQRAASQLSVNHVLSRSVRDSAALLALTEDKAQGARFAPVGLVSEPLRRRLRVGLLLKNGSGNGPQPEVTRAVQNAARLLETLGHQVQPVTWPVDREAFAQDFTLLWSAGAAQAVAEVARAIGRNPDARVLEPFTLASAGNAGAGCDALGAALQRLEGVALAYDTWFVANQIDVVLSPVVSAPPPPIGELAPAVPLETLMARLREYVGYTPLQNVAGAPSMSVPLHWTEAGLPIGSMFSARAGQDGLLLELAYQLEAAQPWARRWPPVHA
jgi:amidase